MNQTAAVTQDTRTEPGTGTASGWEGAQERLGLCWNRQWGIAWAGRGA